MAGGLVVIKYSALRKKRKLKVSEIRNIISILATVAVLYVAYMKKAMILGAVESVKMWAGKSISTFVVNPTGFDLFEYVSSFMTPGVVQTLIRFSLTAVVLGGAAVLIVRIYRASRVPWKRIKFSKITQQRALMMMKHRIKPKFRHGFKFRGDKIVSVPAKKMLPKIKVPYTYKPKKPSSRILPDISDYFEFPPLKEIMPQILFIAIVGFSVVYAINTGIEMPRIELKAPSLQMPSQITGAFGTAASFVAAYGFKAVAGVFVGGAAVVLARGWIKRRRNPWRTDYYKTNRKEVAVAKMRKRTKKMFEKENWVRKI